MRPIRLATILGSVALLAGAIGRPARAAEPPITIENVRVGLAEQPTSGMLKVGAWAPLGVDLKAGPQPFRGFVEAIVPDDDGVPTVVRQAVEVPANDMRTISSLYIRPGTRMPEVRVRVVDQDGRPRGRDYESNDAEIVDASQSLILTMGNPRGVDEVPGLPSFTVPNNPNLSQLKVARARAGGFGRDSIPARWYGYDGVEAIVLDTNDRGVMDILNQKRQGLEQWVRNGGHLIVAVGSNWQQVKDSFLNAMLPAVPAETIPLRDLGALEAFAGATGNKGRLDAMTVARLVPVPGRPHQMLVATASAPPTPLVVRGAYGFGRVTVVALNVDQKPFADWPLKKDFWVKVLDLRGRGANAAQSVMVPGAGGAFYQSTISDLSSVLHRALERFPGVRLVPFGWVAFFVFLYILLIGPGDYFFLKKVLKRMELTWITFPLIVVAVSLIAYIAAYAVKGTDLRVNKVDIVDVDQSGGAKGVALRGSTWLTMFSPRNRDYSVTVVPLSLDRDPKDTSVPARAPSGSEPLVSWFGSTDPVMGGGDRLGLSGSGYSYMPVGEAERLEGVRVAIWSTKSFTGRWSAPTAPVIDSDLRAIGPDRLAGTLTNRLGRELKDVWVAFGNRVYEFPTIAPNATVRIDAASSDRVLASLLQERAKSFQQGGNFVYDSDGQPAIPTGNVLRAIMFRDAMASKEDAASSVPLRHLDLSGQLALERPMLVADIAGPAAALRLEGAPSEPKIEQTTVLRVILPLAPPEGTAASQ